MADVRKGTLADRIAELKAAGNGLRFHSGDECGVHHPLEDFERDWAVLGPIIGVEPYLYIIGNDDEVSAEWPVDGVGEVSLTLGVEGLYMTCSVVYAEPTESQPEDPVFGYSTREECARWIRRRLDEMREVQS